MNDTQKFRLTSDAIVGIALVFLGIVFVLDNFGMIQASDYLRFWPLLLIVFGGIRALQPGAAHVRVVGATVATIGALILLDRLDMFTIDLWNLWPLLLVGAGLAIATRHGRGSSTGQTSATGKDGRVHGTALLGGLEIRSQAHPFNGGHISATLGSAEIDLRDAVIPDGEAVELELLAMLGSVEIRIPGRWRVDSSVICLLGSVENQTAEPSVANAPRLLLRGTAMLGSIELRN